MTKYEYLEKVIICTFKYKGIGFGNVRELNKYKILKDNANTFKKDDFSVKQKEKFNSIFNYTLFDNNAEIFHKNTQRGTHKEIETIDKEKLCHDISQFISEVHHIYVEKSAFEDGNINYSEEYKNSFIILFLKYWHRIYLQIKTVMLILIYTILTMRF